MITKRLSNEIMDKTLFYGSAWWKSAGMRLRTGLFHKFSFVFATKVAILISVAKSELYIDLFASHAQKNIYALFFMQNFFVGKKRFANFTPLINKADYEYSNH